MLIVSQYLFKGGYLELKKYVIIFLLCLTSVVWGQDASRYSTVVFSNGQPITGANVDLYYAGTTTKAFDLTEDVSVSGLYYNDAVAMGVYDLYVNGQITTKKGIVFLTPKIVTIANNFDSAGQLDCWRA